MRRLTIAIDCDDVLVETGEFVITRYNALYGTDLTLAEFYSRDLSRWSAQSLEEASQRVRNLLIESEHGAKPPTPMVINVVKQLAVDHELHLVTGRDDLLRPMTEALTLDYFPGCFTSIEHTNHFIADRKRSKGDVCKVLGADLLVDDHIEHIQSVLDAGLREVIVFGDYPWNNESALPDGAVRCNDWQEVAKEVDRIAGR